MTDVLCKLSAAQIRKRCVTRDDGKRQAKWLEELALEFAIDHPTTEWEALLKQMINAARSKKVNRRHAYIMKGNRRGLDFIKVPESKWYYNPNHKEIYQFSEGLFLAHPCILENEKTFSPQSVLKTP